MVMTDPIADLLTRIRNAIQAKHEETKIPSSKIKKSILEVLKNEGYIEDFKEVGDDKQGFLTVTLKKTYNGKPAISGLKRISKPGRRVYANLESLPKVYNGLGVAVLTTSKGILTDTECKKMNVGGEVICHVW